MNKILISLVALSLFVIGTLFLILYKDSLPINFLKPEQTPQIQSSTQTFKGRITRIIPLDNTKLQIELDTSTPQIIASKDRGIAKLSKTGQIEKLLTADKLKVEDTVEIKMSYDSQTKSYSLESIYLIE